MVVVVVVVVVVLGLIAVSVVMSCSSRSRSTAVGTLSGLCVRVVGASVVGVITTASRRGGSGDTSSTITTTLFLHLRLLGRRHSHRLGTNILASSLDFGR